MNRGSYEVWAPSTARQVTRDDCRAMGSLLLRIGQVVMEADPESDPRASRAARGGDAVRIDSQLGAFFRTNWICPRTVEHRGGKRGRLRQPIVGRGDRDPGIQALQDQPGGDARLVATSKPAAVKENHEGAGPVRPGFGCAFQRSSTFRSCGPYRIFTASGLGLASSKSLNGRPQRTPSHQHENHEKTQHHDVAGSADERSSVHLKVENRRPPATDSLDRSSNSRASHRREAIRDKYSLHHGPGSGMPPQNDHELVELFYLSFRRSVPRSDLTEQG